jgi:hypothetical protein
MVVPRSKEFGADAWASTDDPRVLHLTLEALGVRLSERKLRLTSCAIARRRDPGELEPWTGRAIEVGEALADLEPPPFLPHDVREHCPGELALTCIEPTPQSAWATQSFPDRTAADAVRDQIPNPFVPLEWDAAWFTVAVRDLATHIYSERKFELMPVLADALLDAGCDHELVQEHCRSAKPHARGCWVVDAILGKS